MRSAILAELASATARSCTSPRGRSLDSTFENSVEGMGAKIATQSRFVALVGHSTPAASVCRSTSASLTPQSAASCSSELPSVSDAIMRFEVLIPASPVSRRFCGAASLARPTQDFSRKHGVSQKDGGRGIIL
eukprot:scaffold48_cov311-Pinguiococcus_pyrenoidosus.AAC.24